jgi:hypothetical protein
MKERFFSHITHLEYGESVWVVFFGPVEKGGPDKDERMAGKPHRRRDLDVRRSKGPEPSTRV